MTDIEQKALALVNEIEREEGVIEPTPRIMRGLIMDEALCRAIERHEAFRQEVSDAVWDYYGGEHIPRTSMFAKFAIPKPDPLVAVLEKMGWYIAPNGPTDAENFRAALDAAGFEIREKNNE